MYKYSNIQQLIESYQSALLAQKHLEKVKERLRVEQRRLIDLATALEKEHLDVLKIEHLTLKGIFHRILGDQKQQYEIEKQEYLMATLAYNEAVKTIELLEFEIDILEQKIDQIPELKLQLETLILSRNTDFKRLYPHLVRELISYNEQIDDLLAYKRELHEASIVAVKTLHYFDQVLNHLNNAIIIGGWGFRQPIQPKTLSTPGELDEAFRKMIEIKTLLNLLKDEMEDIYRLGSIQRLGGFQEFNSFTLIFRNRLLSDWILEKDVIGTQNFVAGTKASVQRTKQTLGAQIEITNQQMAYLKAKMEDLLPEYFAKK